MPNVSITQLQAMKNAGEKFAVLTAYDSTFAHAIDAAGIEVILVGDTLGMLVQGHRSTLPVSVADMAYHIGCVARGNSRCLIIGDLPFGSYAMPEQALASAAELMRAGAHVVKLEGGQWLLETIAMLTERGIPVCAHLGLTPQSVNAFGGYKVQGRQPEQARKILEDSKAVEAAGASLLVLECVPHTLSRQISQALTIPTIGIGAGPGTDAQVLVLHDMLGMNSKPAKFVRNFMADAGSIHDAFANYSRAVKEGSFPAPEHCYE